MCKINSEKNDRLSIASRGPKVLHSYCESLVQLSMEPSTGISLIDEEEYEDVHDGVYVRGCACTLAYIQPFS